MNLFFLVSVALFLLLFATFPLTAIASDEPLIGEISQHASRVTFNFQPLSSVVFAPLRLLTIVKEVVDSSSRVVVTRMIHVARSPVDLTVALNHELSIAADTLHNTTARRIIAAPALGLRALKESIANLSSSLVAGSVTPKNPDSSALLGEASKILPVEAPNVPFQPLPKDYGQETNNGNQTETKSPSPIITKETIREIVIQKEPIVQEKTIVIEKPFLLSDNEARLASLKQDLLQTFTSRINTLVGNLGFTSNRFDNLYVNKQVQTGSSSVQLTDATGKLPDVSGTYFSSPPNIFSSIANSIQTIQFTATSTSDLLSFAGSGGTTITFSAATKKITIATSGSNGSITLSDILANGSDASAFTGTTKIGGTLSAGGSASSTSTILTANQTGSGLIADFQQSGSSRFNVNTNGNVTILGRLITGSGTVNLTNDAGKIPALSSTYLADISGSNLTSLNASNVSSGTLGVSVGGTGFSSYTAGDLLYASGTTALSKLGIGAANTVLTSSGSAPQWSSSLTLGGTLTAGGSASSTATILTANQTGSGLIADLQQGGSSRFNVSTNGNVYVSGNLGIGTTTPSAAFHITGSPFTPLMLINQTNSVGDILNVQQNGSSKFYITNAGNVGIGTTSPAALLHVAGTSAIFGVGEAGTPTATTIRGAAASGTNIAGANLTLDASNGTGTGGSGALIFRTAPAGATGTTANTFTERLRIDNTGALTLGTVLSVANGGTGAGTFTSNGVLYGNSTSALQATAQGAANSILTANAGAPAFSASPTIGTSLTVPTLIGGTAVGSTLALRSTTGVGSSDALLFQVGNNGATEAMRITNAGNVGIGTTSPGYQLHVLGANPALLVESNNSGSGGIASLRILSARHFSLSSLGNAGGFSIQDGSVNAERLRIDVSGNVGIGTTSPAALLHVAGTSAIFGVGEAGTPTATTIRGAAASGTNIAGANLTFDASNGTGTGGSGAIIFRTAAAGTTGTTANTFAEAMRITNAGNVGIGTTGPTSGLHVLKAAGASTANVQIGGTARIGPGHDGKLEIQGTTTGIVMNNTTAAADNRIWDFGPGISTTGEFDFRALNDSLATANSFLNVKRSGATISSVNFPNGNVGIGTASFGSATGPVLALLNNGATGPSAVAGQGILWSNAGAGTWRGPTTSTQFAAADYAEEMPTLGIVEQADLVSLSPISHEEADDIHNRFFVERSQKPYDPHIVGIVSSFAPDALTNSKMVALVGRVPVKVSTENSPIKRGDRITSSSLPGIGMKAGKAGMVIGMALEDYQKSASSTTMLLSDGKEVEVGRVLVFINVGYQGNDLHLTLANGVLQEDAWHIIDAKGNVLTLTQEGDIVVKHLVVKDLELAQGGTFTLGKNANISLPSGPGQIVGDVIVPSGQIYQTVTNPAAHIASRILLTARGIPPSSGYSISSQQEGQFTVQLSRQTLSDITFTYLIVNTYSPDNASQLATPPSPPPTTTSANEPVISPLPGKESVHASSTQP